MTMKAHIYYIIFGRPPIGGEASPLPPCRRHWLEASRRAGPSATAATLVVIVAV